MKRIEESGKVSALQSIKDFWLGYFDFRGRSTRAGYWWAQVFIVLIYIILFIITAVSSTNRSYFESAANPFCVFIIILFSVAVLVPLLSLSVRRLRDVGLKSKTILALYILYYGFYGAFIIGIYSSMFSSLSSMMNQYSENYATMPAIELNISPVITFFFMTLSGFFWISVFLPTDMLATKSKHPILSSIFMNK